MLSSRPKYRWEMELENGLVKTERVRVLYAAGCIILHRKPTAGSTTVGCCEVSCSQASIEMLIHFSQQIFQEPADKKRLAFIMFLVTI